MRHLTKIIVAFLLFASIHSFAQEPIDTVVSLKDASEILVTRTGSVTKVYAVAKDEEGGNYPFTYEVRVDDDKTVDEIEIDDTWGLNLPYYTLNGKSSKGSKIRREVIGLEHTYFGWRFNYHDKSHVKNCYEFGCKQFIGIGWSKGRRIKSTFSIGLGWSFMRFLAQDGYVYGKIGDQLVLSPLTDNLRVKSSILDVQTFCIPVFYKQGITKNSNFSIGGILNLNTYASAETVTYNYDYKLKTKYKGLQQNLLTADIFASISIEGIGVYFSWSPMNLFKKCYGPELKGWSIGIDLFSF